MITRHTYCIRQRDWHVTEARTCSVCGRQMNPDEAEHGGILFRLLHPHVSTGSDALSMEV